MTEQARLAVVTGGTGGIGTAICRRLAREGCRVVATCHPSEEGQLAGWREAMAAEGLEIATALGDVSSAEDAARMMAEIEKQHGPVDILVNCAGITRDTTMKRMQAEQWDEVISTNLNSVFYVTKPVWAGMLSRGFGRIVNISSINGQRGQFGQVNYTSAKAGMHGFTMSLAREVARKGVTVNTISPGYIATEMVLAVNEDIRNAIQSEIPVGRFGTPEEVAHCVAFLVSEESGFITGANLAANGGHHME
jgi:acetoacetyl-CoA reductase